MKFINSRELNIKTAEILREAKKDDLIITIRGKPAAILQSFSEGDLEDYILGKIIEKKMKKNPDDFLSEEAEGLDSLRLATEKELGKI
jgi:prevent-host-death family protein